MAFELKRTADGRYMFNILDGNNEIVGTSETYSSMAAMKNGIAAVDRVAPSVPLNDRT